MIIVEGYYIGNGELWPENVSLSRSGSDLGNLSRDMRMEQKRGVTLFCSILSRNDKGSIRNLLSLLSFCCRPFCLAAWGQCIEEPIYRLIISICAIQ